MVFVYFVLFLVFDGFFLCVWCFFVFGGICILFFLFLELVVCFFVQSVCFCLIEMCILCGRIVVYFVVYDCFDWLDVLQCGLLFLCCNYEFCGGLFQSFGDWKYNKEVLFLFLYKFYSLSKDEYYRINFVVKEGLIFMFIE